MTALDAARTIALAAECGAWLRRWLRAIEPYHRAKFETTVTEMAADLQQQIAEQLPRAGVMGRSALANCRPPTRQ